MRSYLIHSSKMDKGKFLLKRKEAWWRHLLKPKDGGYKRVMDRPEGHPLKCGFNSIFYILNQSCNLLWVDFLTRLSQVSIQQQRPIVYRYFKSSNTCTFDSHSDMSSIYTFNGNSGEHVPYDAEFMRIDSSVKIIGENSFRGCTSLRSIVIPLGVTTIGKMAFAECTSLKSIVIDYWRSCLYGMHIPHIDWDSWRRHDYWRKAFYKCTSLVLIAIPQGITTIGHGAFGGCRSLASLVIPQGVTTIGDEAFYDCRSLASIEIPQSVKTIGEKAFGGCSSLAPVPGRRRPNKTPNFEFVA